MHRHLDGLLGRVRWEFEKGSQALAVAVNGALVIDDMDMTIRAAMDGVGLASSLDEYVAPHIARHARSGP